MPISNESRGVSLTLYSEDITVNYLYIILQLPSPNYSFSRNIRRLLQIGTEIQAARFLLGLAQAPSGNIRS
jgi:hypothetical protein